MGEDLYLYESLLVEFSFISDYFQGHNLILLMVKDLQDLSVTALTQFRQNLIPVGDMIMHLIYVLVSELLNKYSVLSKLVDSRGSLLGVLWDMGMFFSLSLVDILCPM
jgi:hypothetical protein